MLQQELIWSLVSFFVQKNQQALLRDLRVLGLTKGFETSFVSSFSNNKSMSSDFFSLLSFNFSFVSSSLITDQQALIF